MTDAGTFLIRTYEPAAAVWRNIKTWQNRHNTFTQPLDNLLDIRNGSFSNITDDYNATTTVVQDLIAKAIQAKIRIKALRGGWSFTKVAAIEGCMLDTKQLNIVLNISAASLSPVYEGKPEDLVFAQTLQRQARQMDPVATQIITA